MEWLAAQVQAALAGVDEFSRWLVGAADGKSSYELTRWVFLRALGVIYLIAFLSLWPQLRGLIGPQGILPAQDLLAAARRQLGGERFHLVPTLFWIDAGPTALHLACALGVVCSVLLILNVAPLPNLVFLWVLYLSLAAVGREFLAYQWDVLLLEAGFLAMLFAPGHLLPRGAARPVSALALFLLWWLLFRLTFQSGIVKLANGDPPWRNLTALAFHFWTQPLPTCTAWSVNLLLAASSVKLWLTFFPYGSLPRVIARPMVWVEPFRSVNSYGLFRVMTTERPEIVVEGSDDGRTWLAYEFRYKPGDPSRRPAFVEPHQPRLDWQMWFAALGRYDYTPWFQAFLARLLEGSPPVLTLMAKNPFHYLPASE